MFFRAGVVESDDVAAPAAAAMPAVTSTSDVAPVDTSVAGAAAAAPEEARLVRFFISRCLLQLFFISLSLSLSLSRYHSLFLLCPSSSPRTRCSDFVADAPLLLNR